MTLKQSNLCNSEVGFQQETKTSPWQGVGSKYKRQEKSLQFYKKKIKEEGEVHLRIYDWPHHRSRCTCLLNELKIILLMIIILSINNN